MAENLVIDDQTNPPQAGSTPGSLKFSFAPPGSETPVEETPTTPAGKSDTNAAKVEAITPGKRTQNPLANFSNYTYQVSLYMITPDAYASFILSGRKNLDGIANLTAAAEAQSSRDAVTSASAPTASIGSPPPPLSSAKKAGGVYLIAQSGGINNTNLKRAPGFDQDFFIDDLKITQNIGTKEVGTTTNYTNITFNITEPYGFSLLTKLRKAQSALGAVTNTPNFGQVQDPARQIYVLGIRFLGYDKNGELIDPTKITGTDGDPQGNAFGLYERFYDIIIRDLKFKITGKAVTYSIVAGNASTVISNGAKFGQIMQDVNVTADTVYNALLGGAGAGVKPGENPNTAPAPGGMIGLLSKLNYDQTQLLGKGVKIAREYDVVFIGPTSDRIKDALLVSNADLDKRKVPTTGITNTSQSNEKVSSDSVQPNLRTIKIAKGTTILQAVNDIIKQSQYMEQALQTIALTNLSPDEYKKAIADTGKEKPDEISWYSMHSEVTNLGWDSNQGDYVYKIKYIIQPYSTPVVVAAGATVIPLYYGPQKRYDYWFTGKNSEIISYEQQMDYAYYNVTINGYGVDSVAQGGATDVPNIQGQQQEQPKTGRLNFGMEAQNAYMTSLFSPRDFGSAKIKILGDPDFLMQPAPSSINSLYSKFYGTDGFTINPNGGQVFIEINFKEPQDYHNDTGLMNMGDSIYFWRYPDSIQTAINKRGGGISYMVKQVISSFSRGKFEQELNCSLNTFGDPGPKSSSNAAFTAEGREATNAGFVQAAGEVGRGAVTGSAPTSSGTSTTPGTGFASGASSAVVNTATTIRGIDNAIIQQQNTQGTIQAATGVVADGDLTGG